MKKLLLVCALSLAGWTAMAQMGPRLDFTPYIPQAVYQNPANIPWCSTYLALPGISGINASATNNITSLQGLGLTLDDLATENFINRDVLDRLAVAGQNSTIFRAGTEIELLGFGFRKGNHFFGLSIREQVFSQINVPQDLLQFPSDEANDFAGAPDSYDLSDFAFSAIHYRPYTLHYAWTAPTGMTVGLQAAYLGGKYSVRSDNDDLQLLQPYGNALGFNVDGSVFFLNSGFLTDEADDTNTRDILLHPQNHGVSFGFGIHYQFPNKRTEFMLSAVNLGFIDWNKNMGYTYFNSEHIDKEQNFDEVWDQVFQVETMADTSYRQAIPPFFSMTINQYVAPQTSIGAFYQASPYLGQLHNTFGVSANTRVREWMGASLGYVYAQGTHNLSAGMTFNAGPVQLYLLTDNLVGAIKPKSAQHFNARAGINFTFGDRSTPGRDDRIQQREARKEIPPFPVAEPITSPGNESPDTTVTVGEQPTGGPAPTKSPLVDPFHFAQGEGPDKYVSTGTILLFREPDLAAVVIDKLSTGDTIRALEQRPDNWWLVQSDIHTGWLQADDLLIPLNPVTSGTETDSTDQIDERPEVPKRDTFLVLTDIPLYQQPYPESKVLISLKANDLVVLYDKENYKWWYVASNNRGGWVESLYLAPYSSDSEFEGVDSEKTTDIPETPTKEETEEPGRTRPAPPSVSDLELRSLGTYIMTRSTTMRSGPSQDTEAIVRLREGYKVELLERSTKYWWKVRYGSQIGYAKAAKMEKR